MLETALTAFTTFFATIGPIESAVIFVTLTPGLDKKTRRSISLKAALIATFIILSFALLGQPILNRLGVTLAALQTAGGIILFFISIDMIFARQSGAISMSLTESDEAENKADIAVFPLATPILAGPGAMSGAILLAANTENDPFLLLVVISALIAVMILAAIFLLIAQEIHDFIGVTAQKVIVRVMGILLSALAVQSIFDGLSASAIIPKLVE